MVKYEYTDKNRLRSPHAYMYAPYQGEAFIHSYFRAREENINRFELQLLTEELVGIDFYLHDASRLLLTQRIKSSKHETIKNISYFNRKPKVKTEDLLLALIAEQFSCSQNECVKSWIDFLVQRFEVSKKLYEVYHSSKLRKYDGNYENVRLYWLFSLLLTLYYFSNNNLKYLSANLKINDTICSLEDNLLKDIPKQGLVLILSHEMRSINILFSKITGACS